MELLHGAERYSSLVEEVRKLHAERQVHIVGRWKTQRRRLRKALRNSDGKAIVVVHPFYPAENDEIRDRTDLYAQYTSGLLDELVEYRNQGLPVIFFEVESPRGAIRKKIDTLALPVNSTFVVQTSPYSPQPSSMRLNDFSQRLFQYGVREAVVVGSNLWFSSHHFPPVVPGGCVGTVLLNLNKAGIHTAFGKSTFPEKKSS